MSTGGETGAVAVEPRAAPKGEPMELMDTPGDDRVRTGAAVVAENHPPPLPESASREQPPTAASIPAPTPTSGPDGSTTAAASVESQPLEEQHQAPQSSDMVVPVKAGDPADAKQRKPEAAANLAKAPSAAGGPTSPVPPPSEGNEVTPSAQKSRPSSAVGEVEKSEMGAEGSKLSSGRFRKGSSTDVHPAEETSAGPKRPASSTAGLVTRNGRDNLSGSDVSNGHKEAVHPVTDETGKPLSLERPESAASSRTSSRQESSSSVGVEDPASNSRKYPLLVSPSPGKGDSKSPSSDHVSSKPSSPDLIKVHSVSPTVARSKLISPAENQISDAVKTKTPSPDIDEAGRRTPNSKKIETERGKSPFPDSNKDGKTPSPELQKTKSNGSLRSSGSATPDLGKPDKRLSEEVSDGVLLRADSTGRRTPASEMSRSKSPLSEQTKVNSPSPEPARAKSSSPESAGVPVSPTAVLSKSSSPDLKNGSIKTANSTMAVLGTERDNLPVNIKRSKSPSIEVNQPELDGRPKQKSPSPELHSTKSVSPGTSLEKTNMQDIQRLKQKTPDVAFGTKHADEDTEGNSKIKSENSSKSSTPEIPKSKSITPEPLRSKPLTPEPLKSKPSTPESSKSKKSSVDTLDTDLQRSSSRISNVSDGDLKEPTSPAASKSKSISPELPSSRKVSPELTSSKPSTPEPDKNRSSSSDIQRSKSNTPELSKPSNVKEREASKTPEPMKTKSPSQDSVKTEYLPPSSPKPEAVSKTLNTRSIPQKLESKSPSPETGNRVSNPPSISASPEPVKATPSASPELNSYKSTSRLEGPKGTTSPESREAPGKRNEAKSPDVGPKSPSSDSAKLHEGKDEREHPSNDQENASGIISAPKAKSPVGKVTPTKLEETSDRVQTPQKTNIHSEQVKPLSPLLSKQTTPEPRKPDSPTSAKSGSPKSDSPLIPALTEPSKINHSVHPKSPSPLDGKTNYSPPKSPVPSGNSHLVSTDKPAVTGKPSPLAGENGHSPVVSKSPSPVSDKVAPQTASKTPSPSLAKSISPTEKVQLSESASRSEVTKTNGSPSPEPLKLKNLITPERPATPVSSSQEKSPTPELITDKKPKSPSPTDQSIRKRPGSRQGISPDVVLSPSEDSGRISASPDNSGRKSSASPKPTSPLPSSRSVVSPMPATPISPKSQKRADSTTEEQRTPDSAITPADLKATTVSSPTSEASNTSRTGSASAGPSSTEAATPDEDRKVAGATAKGDKALGASKSLLNGDGGKEMKIKEVKMDGEPKKKKPEPSKPGTPSRTLRSSRSVDPSPRTPRRTTPRTRRKDGDQEKDSSASRAKSEENKASTNGEIVSPTKKSPTKIPAAKKSPATPTAAASSPARPPLKSPAKSAPKTPPALTPAPEPEKKKVPMNKVQVGTAASPNLKAVRSKIGSLDNAAYKPGGGKVKIENRKLDFSKTAPKIAAKNETYTPGGGDKKIQKVKLTWSAKPKVGSLDNATYKPGGGEKKIETVKLDFKDKAKSKVGSKDNIKHAPGGGTVKKTTCTKDDTNSNIENQKLEFKDKAQSKIGSLDNVKHKPGGGDRKIFDDKDYLKQVGGTSSKASSEGVASGAQSPVPPMSPQRLSEENSVEES